MQVDCSTHSNYRKPLSERFWPKVSKTDDCWLWIGSINSDGYGRLHGADGYLRAHRLSWELHYGPIPEGMSVLHSCDVKYPARDITYRRCVRPDHLYLGTQIENVRDIYVSNRQPDKSGVHNGRAKLSIDTVLLIRRISLETGYSAKKIAEQLGLAYGTVDAVISRRHWKNI